MLRSTNRTYSHLIRTAPRGSSRTFQTNARRQAAHSSQSVKQSRVLRTGLVLAVGSSVVAVSFLQSQPILNDAGPSRRTGGSTLLNLNIPSNGDHDHLTTIAFGSNREGLLSPEHPKDQTFRSPSSVKWLHDTPLRDLVLHEEYAACVDVKGNVYLWGNVFKGEKPEDVHDRPKLVLGGKDILSIQASDSSILAVSSSGKIFSIPASKRRRTKVTDNKQSSSSWNPFSWMFGGRPEEIGDAVELRAIDKLNKGEKFVSLSSGAHHVLALTSEGRTFAHPLSKQANDFGQLGLQRVTPATSSSDKNTSANDGPSQDQPSANLVPKLLKDPYGGSTAYARTSNGISVDHVLPELSSSAPRYCNELYEIPSLRGIRISQAVAGAKASYVRTDDEGRVLAWGANQFGQLGLGSTVTADAILVPTEVVFSGSAPRGARSRCVDIATGGDVTFFTIERQSGASKQYSTDVLACGMGQWGTLGNGVYSSAQGEPARIKAVSGLMEFSDKTNTVQPIVPYAISASRAPMGHVLLTLDTLERAGNEESGRDLLVWGNGREYQLGNGRRSSLASPISLDTNPATISKSDTAKNEKGGEAQSVGEFSAGSPNRLMLRKKRASVVRDMEGNVVRGYGGVEVEQCTVAGFGASIIYWKVLRK